MEYENVLKKIVCPYDHSVVFKKNDVYECSECKRQYPIIENRIIDFLPDDLRGKTNHIENQTQENYVDLKKWKPGLRYWRPGIVAKIISFGKGNGRKNDIYPGMIKLDVGCGGAAQGDVNCDLYIPTPLPKNFFLASSELLPFNDSAFEVVRSAYVIEHSLYPTEMIKEHLRVSSKIVKTYTDNSDWIGAIALRVLNTGYIFHDEHYFKWSKEYFSNIINRLNLRGKVQLLNSSPSIIIKLISLLGILPRIGPVFYRDLCVELIKE